MNSRLFVLNWLDVKNALILGLLTALVVVILDIISVGDIFSLNWKNLINAGVIAFLSSFVSLLKDLLTTQNGNFVGSVKIR